MAKNKSNKKLSTDALIDNAIANQNRWLEKRRTFSRRFLKDLNMFACPAPRAENVSVDADAVLAARNRRGGWMAYWFPICCAILVVLIAFWALFIRTPSHQIVSDDIVVPAAAAPVADDVAEIITPTFDIVRIQPDGMVIVAGRWMANTGVSIMQNGRVVATLLTDDNGEFAYVPTHALAAGNYTFALVGADGTKSEDQVFVYISDAGYENSVSLLMTSDGSTLLQAPTMLRDGDLAVSKIDYLDTGRIVVTGDALPRLRVSLALDGKYLGFARVSDHRHFGLGADVGQLETGREYELAVRLHDGDGRTVATIMHTFTMPEMTGDEDTFYTVRRGDCLWIIARNFLRRGILFSIIAERNNIKNPDLIFPHQELQIPVNGGK